MMAEVRPYVVIITSVLGQHIGGRFRTPLRLRWAICTIESSSAQ